MSTTPAPGAGTAASVCGHCGLPAGAGPHDSCRERLELEPPRFCVACGRRMKVQVVPGGWSADCVAHGRLERSTWA